MFCDNFKKYRKRVGMTQEEVARMLMVTPQAVSKWETGGGTPDISLLVPIAELFGISTDELLGYANTEQLSALDEQYHSSKETRKELYDKYIDLLKTNPTNESILSRLLSLTAERLVAEKELDATEKDALVSAAEEFANRLQTGKTCFAPAETCGKLADVYTYAGDYKQAKETIEQLPGSRYTKNRMLGNLALREGRAEEGIAFYRESVYDTVSFLLWDIERIAQCHSTALREDFAGVRAKMDEIYAVEYALIHAIGAEGSPLLQSHLCNASIRLAQKAVRDNEYEKAFGYLDKFMQGASELQGGVSEQSTPHSPVLPTKPHAVQPISKESMQYRLSWNTFNPIRNDERFAKYLSQVDSWE